MIHRKLLIATSILATILSNNDAQAQPSEPVAVIELFTTESCSSCPSADELLEEMVGLTRAEGKKVIGLAFHVTYFNHLGWVDPYSNNEFTLRQKKYCELLNVESGVYTPQGIVNGQFEFVGSNPIGFRNFVDQSCAQPATYRIEATAKLHNDSLRVDYTVNVEPKKDVINIAIIENHIQRKITHGENKDRTLKHFNVVRKFETRNLKQQDSVTLLFPEELELNNSSLILFVQNKKTLKVLGAVMFNLGNGNIN